MKRDRKPFHGPPSEQRKTRKLALIVFVLFVPCSGFAAYVSNEEFQRKVDGYVFQVVHNIGLREALASTRSKH